MIPIRGLRAPVSVFRVEPAPVPVPVPLRVVVPFPPTVAALNTRQIITSVARAFRLAPDDLTGLCRVKRNVAARAVAIRLMRDRKWDNGEHRYSTIFIGRLFYRDHSTVCHALDTFDDRMKANPEASRIYHALRDASL